MIHTIEQGYRHEFMGAFMNTGFRWFLLPILCFASLFACCQDDDEEQKYCCINGVVTDSESGDFLENTCLYLAPDGIATYSDEYGAYSFVDLAPGEYTINASRDGFHSLNQIVRPHAGDVESLDFALLPAIGSDPDPNPENGYIFGHVIDFQNSEPIANVVISKYPNYDDTYTDNSGYYEFVDLPAGSYTILASMAGFESVTIFCQVDSATGTEVNIALEYINVYGDIIGTVIDPYSNEGLEGIRVSIEPGSDPDMTDQDGHFAFYNLVGGSYSLCASINSSAIVDTTVSVVPGDTTIVTLCLENPYGSLSGCIYDGITNAKIGGARITTYPNTGTAVSDADGNYLVNFIPSGEYRILVSVYGYELFYTIPIFLEEREDLTLDIPVYQEVAGNGQVFGTVCDGNTMEALRDVDISDETGASTLSDADGEFCLTVEAGCRHLTFEKTGYSTIERVEYIPADDSIVLNILLIPEGTEF